MRPSLFKSVVARPETGELRALAVARTVAASYDHPNRLRGFGLTGLLIFEKQEECESPSAHGTSSESMTYVQSSWAKLFPACLVGPRSWLTKQRSPSFQHVSLGNPIIPDKPTWSSTSANCSIKQVPMRLQQIPANLKNTHSPHYNGHIQAFPAHPTRHSHSPAQSGYGTDDPIPRGRQAHAH